MASVSINGAPEDCQTGQGRVKNTAYTVKPSQDRVKTALPTFHPKVRVKTAGPTTHLPPRSSNDNIVDQSDFKSKHYKKQFLSEIREIFDRINKDMRDKSEVAKIIKTDTKCAMSKVSSSETDTNKVSPSKTDKKSASFSEVSV